MDFLAVWDCSYCAENVEARRRIWIDLIGMERVMSCGARMGNDKRHFSHCCC